MTDKIINIHDLPSGVKYKSIKDLNLEKTHSIPIQSLVEVKTAGVRLFVVSHSRDCDGTPLYCLCSDKDDIVQHREFFGNRTWDMGWPEGVLQLIHSDK